MQILFYIPFETLDQCFAKTDLARLTDNHCYKIVDPSRAAALWRNVAPEYDVLVTGWGTPGLTDDLLNAVPNLRLLLHSAGSVKHLLPSSFWDREILLATCRDALAVGVAETTLGMIIAGLKRFFPCDRMTRTGGWKSEAHAPELRIRELFDVRIGIVGASRVGRHLIRLLKSFEVSVVVSDPYLDEVDAANLGVVSVSLDELITTSDVVTLHAPDLPETRRLFGRDQFAQMKDDAIFINTARGSLVDETALVAELKTGRITAFIDVTDPEPPAPNHPLRGLSNCAITPHIAGAISNGCLRMGRSTIDQLISFAADGSLSGHITENRLATLG